MGDPRLPRAHGGPFAKVRAGRSSCTFRERGAGMAHRGTSRIVLGLTASALIAGALAGCSANGASGGNSSDGSTPVAAPAASGGLAALQEFAALPAAEQQVQLQEVTESLDRQLITMSGLEKELGGAAKADAAYAALSRMARELAQSTIDQPNFGRFGAFVPAGDAPTQGGLMFGNFMSGVLLQDAAVDAAKDVAPGTRPAPASQSLDNPPKGGKGDIILEGDLAKSSLGLEGEFTSDGITGKLKTVITVTPCPDPTGEFTSTTTMTATIASGRGTGSNLTIEMRITGQVDDDAQLTSYDVDTRTESAQFANSKGVYADQSVGWTTSGDVAGNYRAKVNRTGGAVTEEFVADQGKWSLFVAVMMKDKAVDAARKGWQSGRCVKLEPTTDPSKRKGLTPSAAVSITAAPRSKVDGGPVGGTVTATLNGDSSVDPAGSKVKADATFAYVAPSDRDTSATVTLEARSKRGVAKAEVAFDTKKASYTASGKQGSLTFSGTVSDVTQPFTIAATGGAQGTFSYVPADETGRSGDMSYAGNVGGFKMTDSGTYTITGDDGGVLVLTQTHGACTAGSINCAGGTAKITLTPAG
jgi:hypothetical protein